MSKIVLSVKMTWFVTKFLSASTTTIPTITKQKLLSFWQLYNTSLNAAEQCQFIFCHNPNKYNTWKVHNLVLVLQISRCFLGQQNLQDLGLVLNRLKKRLILFAAVWQVLPSRPAGRRRDRHSAAQLVDRQARAPARRPKKLWQPKVSPVWSWSNNLTTTNERTNLVSASRAVRTGRGQSQEIL